MYDQLKSIRSSPTSSSLTTTTLSQSHQHHRHAYMHVICLSCLLGCDPSHRVTCRFCGTDHAPVNSDIIQIGTLYKFDLLAAFAQTSCCREQRLACQHCRTPLINPDETSPSASEPVLSFSSFSDEHECRKCGTRAFHFVKPLDEIFLPTRCSLKKHSNKM